MFNDKNTVIPENLAIHKPKKELLEVVQNKIFEDKILFECESDFHDITVVENKIGRFLHFDNTYQAGIINTDFYKGNLPYINYFLIPYLMNPKIERILLIGLGSGKLVNDYEYLFDNLKQIDVIDIEENILHIATEYFDFQQSEKFNFELQDGITYLRNSQTKYDLIVVDVANNDGIDKRFVEQEYFELIKKSLKKDGIFVSNLCSSPDLQNAKNKFFKQIYNIHKEYFNYVDVYKGDYSDKVYYKCFYNLDERVIDITNIIFICSNKYTLKNCQKCNYEKYFRKFNDLKVIIQKYLDDLQFEF